MRPDRSEQLDLSLMVQSSSHLLLGSAMFLIPLGIESHQTPSELRPSGTGLMPKSTAWAAMSDEVSMMGGTRLILHWVSSLGEAG